MVKSTTQDSSRLNTNLMAHRKSVVHVHNCTVPLYQWYILIHFGNRFYTLPVLLTTFWCSLSCGPLLTHIPSSIYTSHLNYTLLICSSTSLRTVYFSITPIVIQIFLRSFSATTILRIVCGLQNMIDSFLYNGPKVWQEDIPSTTATNRLLYNAVCGKILVVLNCDH